MAFEIRDLIFSIEPDEGSARLRLDGNDEKTGAVAVAAHKIDCGRTFPTPVRGSVPVNRLETLRSALADLAAQVDAELKRQGGS